MAEEGEGGLVVSLWTYRARLVEVTDADTARLELDHGMCIRSLQSVRVRGVDAPELSTAAGRAAREFTKTWFRDHDHGDEWPFVVTTEKDRRSFARYVGHLTCGRGHELAADLIAAGHGVRR